MFVRRPRRAVLGTAATAALWAVLAAAAPAQEAAQAIPPASQEASEDSVKIYFGSGSASVVGEQTSALDRAARLYRDASPFVMIVAGAADTVGGADYNLDLSVRRARAVADGLVARGIPADRLQVLGRGLSELPVSTGPGTPERENRVVEITWRLEPQG